MAVEVKSYFLRTLQLANLFEAHMAQFLCGDEDVDRAKKLLLSCAPMLFWLVSERMTEASATGLYRLSNIGGGSVSLAALALEGRDVPFPLREALFHALRPDRHEGCVHWWDDVVRVEWLKPLLFELEAKGSLLPLIDLNSSGEEDAELAWRARHHDAWHRKGPR